ncbi:MtrB/PioB family decaheme-associated outer membrane protein [Shewanella psychromarinicola]|uniref:MtrB/PioB family decaheme-associated outer membrane protein n=1 Tax=Shewanella psychromarinicola TaxID=2487742 RepID=A0A3N4DCD7_9GAMM|nr:MtrB/PioB family decaheme-associated outer membrane protein [Shewanella psychromarinicola]AZG33583.1 MtrB/PioB family decaheme-associated outer membrane protein [Shewanella psychromarinicola]MCL1082469.1 MtrB/PioB family decaheme-associated outer membrane protein [Shewanella psychromarinicola]RPA23623.1 MtrB/PioB family decaheme-associated outer membrane protein [Shewanella psychromarinicola]
MRFKFNLITLSLLAISGAITGSAMAADFGVNKANTSTVNQQVFQCKRCPQVAGYTGTIGVNAAYIDSDDIHSGNAFGTDNDGANGSVDADLHYRNTAGYKAKFQAHQLGLDNGFAHLEAGKSGHYKLVADYQQLTRYQSGDARSQLWYQDGVLTPSEHTQIQELSLQRNKAGLGLSYGQDFYQAYVRYEHENKTGYQSSSIVTPRPVNFGLPVDANTDNLTAGLSLSGDSWTTNLNYFVSQYKNEVDALSLPYLYDVFAPAPDNQAHQISLSGQYQLNRTVMSGRLASGKMTQDDDLIQMSGNPLQNWDGEVDTLDGKLSVTSLLSNKLRLGGSVDYSKRDNKGSVWEFAQYEVNGITGAFKQNIPLDTERRGLKLNASYRLNSDYRVQAGYDRKEMERSYGDREQTNDDALWAKLNVRAMDDIKLKFKASLDNRGGSEYQTSELTSSETNPLLRKYYLADRKRTAFEAKFNHTPTSWLSVDMTARYAKDDYNETQLGLTESEDYGYDINLGLQLNAHLSGYAFAGQQWIDAAQAGSQGFSSPDWFADIEDEFINLGAGFNYSGLLEDRLSLGGDYLFANSASNTLVTYDVTTPQGDYTSFSHSLKLHANYALSEEMALKLAYQYERYYDTDYAQIDVNTVPGLTTLGSLNHNYNAHQVMLSFSYQLR